MLDWLEAAGGGLGVFKGLKEEFCGFELEVLPVGRFVCWRPRAACCRADSGGFVS